MTTAADYFEMVDTSDIDLQPLAVAGLTIAILVVIQPFSSTQILALGIAVVAVGGILGAVS